MAFIRHAPNGNGRRHNNNGGHSNNRPRYNNGGSSNGGNNNQSRRPQSRLNQVFDSNAPDARVRGTALQIVEKYQGLARDAQSSGDRVLAQSYQQHAEHYQRLHNEILEEHTAIEAERNAWRQTQQQTNPDQGEGAFEYSESQPRNIDNGTQSAAENFSQNPTDVSLAAPPLAPRAQQPRTENQRRRPQPSPDVPDVEELPSFLSIPIRTAQPAKPAAPGKNNEPPLVEAVVTRPRRRVSPPVVPVEE